MKAGVTRLAALFLGKTGAILVGILFLPLYRSALGDSVFGQVAIVLSLQALALMADFGASVLVGRDVAAAPPDSPAAASVWRHAEAGVTALYLLLLLAATAYCGLGGRSMAELGTAAGGLALLLFSVLQNVAQTALLARSHFILASSLQLSGTLFRASVTWAVLRWWDASLLAFVWTQTAIAAVHLMASRHFCQQLLLPNGAAMPVSKTAVMAFLRRGLPLLFTGLAGAAVMQLDKPLVSLFVPFAEVSPYFLAMSLSALPTNLLAAPVVQYFQPQLIRSFQATDPLAGARIVRRFTWTLIAAVALPTGVLWMHAETVVGMWLGPAERAGMVVDYTRTLLPAFALGSLCYVPVTLLTVAQDFRYQAITSALMTVIALLIVAAGAAAGRVDWVCYAYVVYFLLAAVSVWLRSLSLPLLRPMATHSAQHSVVPLVSLTALAALTFFGSALLS